MIEQNKILLFGHCGNWQVASNGRLKFAIIFFDLDDNLITYRRC